MATPSSTKTAYHLAQQVVQLLKESGGIVGIAESLTGGGVMATLTSVPGCSAVFRGGLVAYATPLKQHRLNVDGQLIFDHGVIHGDVALQMARGARDITSWDGTAEKTSWGIGTTGVAGPDSQDGKPVGTVFIGVASDRGEKSFEFLFEGDRQQIRDATILNAFSLLQQELLSVKPQN